MIALSGCGARTGVGTGSPPPDGGPPDAAPPLTVDCGRSVQYTTPRRPHSLVATVASEAGVASAGWSLLDAPSGAVASVVPSAGTTATLNQDTPGVYRVRFTATDGAGRTASCEVQVESIVGPPRAICPEEELRTTSGVPLTLIGDGFDDEVVVAYRWEVVEGPGPASLSAPDAPTTDFVADALGAYRVRLTVTDNDAATNSCEVTVVVTTPPQLVCPDLIEAPTRRETLLEVVATDDTEVRSVEWELVEAPTGSRATVMPAGREGSTWRARFTPDRQGRYVVRVVATDEHGLTAVCQLVIEGLPTPPDARCPDTIVTTPMTTVTLEGGAVDDGEIVRWRWSLEDVPPGSRADAPRPNDRQTTRFTPDLAGEYRITLRVVDDDGDAATCDVLVRALAREGLRVEMFWDTNGTDMDLHLLDSGADMWRTSSDCYFANCTGGRLDWGLGGPDDDPRLDIDDINGYGPENINIDEPRPGTYRIGVYAYDGTGRVTVRVYCGTASTEPVATFGPRRLRGRGSSHDFWRVADVEVGGGTCRVAPLDAVRSERHDGSPFPR